MQDAEHFDVVIVGAGFAGLYLLHRLRGQGMSAVALEAADGVGGTWYWNRYPGARCDVESMQYSYSFDEELQQEWRWSERFATQPEILRYANHVADRFDLRRDIRFNTRVSGAEFDAGRDRWTVRTEQGGTFTGRFCVMATGCLSSTRLPEFPGLESFRGKTYHTGQWPHGGVDFTGQRVGVVGTGSSAIQAIPVIAEQAEHLFVFQRTPNFSIPAHNRPIDEAYERSWKDRYAERRQQARQMRTGIDYPINQASALELEKAERDRVYEERWQLGSTSFMAAFSDLITDRAANETAAEFVRRKIRSLVHDPAVAELLCPDNHPIGTKRICVDTGYYQTFNRDNVTLVNLREGGIEAITPTGLRTAKAEYELDSIVFATGFDAMTGTLLAMDIRGSGGRTLAEAWEAGPVTYLGLMVAGFPNLFTVTGPGSPSVLSNMIVSIEQHVEWITDAMAYLRRQGLTRIEATEQAQEDWVRHANEVAHRTLYPQANSWYMGVNIPGKPQVFMPYIGGVGTYRQICEEVAAEGYRGFALSGASSAAAAE
ncbi:flavin-containing monooxygenase [Rhodovarius lipocyclicus]|uniref:flavin-containing monooxygenase n=1 Tax=Rhodovarius lipocyclicus TaxID=268410 RepID=UPI001357AEE7|nr:NAD(P)/FAD-dependent oxidoreductase [Rhodovarius lipocyclicus]